MAINYTALHSEIDNDPTNLGLQALRTLGSDDGIAAVLNDKTRGETLIDSLTIADFSIFLAATGLRAKLKSGASSDNPAVSTVCETALELLISPHFSYFDIADSTTMAMVDALVTATVFTSQDRATLVGRATRACSRAEKLFGRGVTVSGSDVARALRG
jgi:hypothetical protein